MASDLPASAYRILDVPLNNNTESLELDLDEICGGEGSVDEIVGIFVGEKLSVKYWTRGVMEYWRRDLREDGVSLGEQGIQALRAQGRSEECLPLLCQLVTGLVCLAKNLPTMKLEAASYDLLPDAQPVKEVYLSRALLYVNEATAIDPKNPLVLDARVALFLAKKEFDQVLNTCEQILKDSPTHLPALLAKARVLFHRKYYRPALKIYQQVLSQAPMFLPDPRIGIGCCFWFLGETSMAKKAWQRSIAVHPGNASQSAQVLLGLVNFHASRDIHLSDEAKLTAYQESMSYIQGTFKTNRNIAISAAILASHFLTANNWATATKMAERAVQYADATPILVEARLVLARAFHAQGKLVEAQKEYQAAIALDRSILNPVLGVAQIMVAQNEYVPAINTFENVLRRQPRCIEALVNLAALRTHLAFTSSSSTEAAAEKTKARDLYEQITRLFATRIKKPGAAPQDPGIMPPRIREVASDPDLYIDIARLSTDTDIGRALKGYCQSLTVRKDLDKSIPAMLFNNIGVLEWKNGNLREAQEQIESALAATASAVVGDESERETNERAAVCMLYNLGVVCEDTGEKEKAKDIYERILLRHPEYVDAKARLALMHLSHRNFDKANGLLKEALTSQTGNGELRALYTYFLIESNQIKQARDFSVATLKDHDKQDIYALCASGALLYTQARENKDPGPEASMERANRFFRAAEFFEKAIQLDHHCAFAAQGLAIALAEHVIGGASMGSQNGSSSGVDGNAIRAKNIRDAITIFTKVKEAVNDGSVYVNLGHCYYLRDEFERSIENYNTASKRFYQGKNIPVLLYLARAWFQKASKDQSFASLRNALTNAQAAQELNPRDAAIAFNVALIQQKGLELLLDLDAAKRTLSDIKIAITDAQAAQEAFGMLASQKPGSVPFETDIAHQRKRYGESLLRRTAEIQDAQQEYESTESAKIERARQEREAERQRIADAELSRLQEIAARNEELARKRQEMQESAATWYVKRESDNESDGGKKKKKQGGGKRKTKESGVTIVDDGDLNEEGSDVEEKKPKRKRTKKQKERENNTPVRGVRAASTADDENESDEGPTLKPSGKRKSTKIYKSAEFVDDESD